MKNVEIYDQYTNVYLNNQTNELIVLNLNYNEELDTNLYTLVNSSSGFVTSKGENLNTESALSLVEELYVESQNLGENYQEKNINLENGYVEMIISFNDGKKLNRVIYIKDNL
jgi:selenophosphate synthetase-related protein